MAVHRISPSSVDRERDLPHPLQLAAWRAMGPAARTQRGIALRRQARRWKLEALRSQHPEWDDAQLRTELAKLYLRGRS